MNPVFDHLLLCSKILLLKDEELTIESDKMLGVLRGKIHLIQDIPSNLDHLKAKNIHRFENHLICPGFVNSHSHLPMSLFRGLADKQSLDVWLKDFIFPLEREKINAQSARIGTALSLLEFIRSGITSCFDMYFYNEAIAETLQESGLRGIIGVGFPSPEKDSQQWRQKTLRLKEKFKDHRRVSIGVAPHAPYTVDAKRLSEMAEFSRSEDLPLVIHVSETEWEQREIQKKHGQSPVEWLHSLNVTGKRSLFVHCVHIDEKDMDIMAETQTSLSYNPSSNMKLGSGIAPISAALKKGVCLSLGTDSSASNNSLNFFKEMGIGAKLQALKYGPGVVNAEEIFKMATIKGAKALGMEKEIGSLDLGKRADIIALDLKSPAFYPPYDLLSHLVYSSVGKELCFVMCEGRVLMEKGEIKSLEEEKILKECALFAEEIKSFLSKKLY